jgi:enoyl-CoA hydratase
MDSDLPAELAVSADGGVRVVTLNRPDDLNAANAAMHEGLVRLWGRLEADADARAVVLTGAGRAFSAGGDFAFMRAQHTDTAYRAEVFEQSRRLVRAMIRFPLPVIAAVNGPAVGLGCSLVVASDIVLMSDRAFLADPHVAVGLVAGDGGTALWPLLTSLVRAKEYLFTGDRIPAPLAVEIGLANRVVAHDDLLDEALALARRLSDMPAQALRDTKRALNAHVAKAVAGILDFSLAAEFVTMGSEEHQAIVTRPGHG